MKKAIIWCGMLVSFSAPALIVISCNKESKNYVTFPDKKYDTVDGKELKLGFDEYTLSMGKSYWNDAGTNYVTNYQFAIIFSLNKFAAQRVDIPGNYYGSNRIVFTVTFDQNDLNPSNRYIFDYINNNLTEESKIYISLVDKFVHENNYFSDVAMNQIFSDYINNLRARIAI